MTEKELFFKAASCVYEELKMEDYPVRETGKFDILYNRKVPATMESVQIMKSMFEGSTNAVHNRAYMAIKWCIAEYELANLIKKQEKSLEVKYGR